MANININTPASGLDVFLRFGNMLSDPTEISYTIKEPGGSNIGSGVGFKRSVGHYDARNTVIPSGFADEVWKIIWDFTAPTNITSTFTEEFCVETQLVIIPIDVNDIIDQISVDLDLGDTYTDEELAVFIKKALNRLNRKLRFCGTDLEMTFDSMTGEVTPTPNCTILDLILLQVECMILKSSRITAVGKGIRVRDGDSEVDTTAGFSGRNAVVSDACSELTDAIKDFLWQQTANDGEIIWYGNSRIIGIMDHNGEGTGAERDFSSPFDAGGGWTVSGRC